MLTWISEQAKWVIYIFIVFILAGLLFMDMSQLQTDKTPPVAKVNDELVSNAEFQSRLQQIQQAQAGQNLTDAQNAQMRQELLGQFIQERLMTKAIAELQLFGSDAELWHDLITEPIPGVQKAPVFMTDSVFDMAKYRAWLDTSIAGSISDPQLIQYREFLRSTKVPQRQLQALVTAGFHPSTLEAKWTAVHRETKFKLWVAQTSVDSFPQETPDSSAVRAYFTANPDSFYIPRDMAKVQYVALSITPSEGDERSSREWAQMLINQLKEGADFAELAKMNSEDQATMENGGEVVDPSVWGPVYQTALATLDSGATVTEPIRSGSGWHIIQGLGKTGTGDSAKVKSRHILVKISASTETVDSLSNLLKSVKEEVDLEKPFAEVAAAHKLPVSVTDWFSKGDEIPGIGYMQGLSSYVFRNPEMPRSEDIASSVLQNKDVVALFVKSDSLVAGTRQLVPFEGYIAGNLSNQKRLQAAIQYLGTKANEVSAVANIDSTNRLSIAKVILDTAETAFEGFVPGLGYASPAMYRVLSRAQIGAWTPVSEGTRAAVMVKLLSKTEPDAAALEAQIAQEVQSAWMYANYSMFNEYVKNLQDGAKVVNNLDLYFAE